MEKYVCKFGGSSVETFGQIQTIVKDDPRRQYIVLSAPGDQDRSKRVTPLLAELAEQRLQGHRNNPSKCQTIDFIVAKYEHSFGIHSPETGDRLRQRLDTPQDDPAAYIAAVKAFGEEESARLAAPLLDAEFDDARTFMHVQGPFDHATVLPRAYKAMYKLLAKKQARCVIPGFYGIRNDGLIATFSWGGSDQTGAEVARGIHADLYENFTDSPICAADPRIVPHAKIIPTMTRQELRDLSYGGFTIFHPEAVKPLDGTMIPLHVRSTKNYPQLGTLVMEERVSDPLRPITGIAYQHGFCSFSFSKIGLNDADGTMARTTAIFYNPKQGINIPIEFPASGIDDVTFIVRQAAFHDGQLLSQVKAELHNTIGANGARVRFRENLSCLVVAGKGLMSDDRANAYAELALADAGVRIIASSKGAERRCLLYAVPQKQAEQAVRALYQRFIE